VEHFETRRRHRDGRLVDVSLTDFARARRTREGDRRVEGGARYWRAEAVLGTSWYVCCDRQFSDDAIISKDLESIITSWNTGRADVWLYASEAIGRPIWMLFPPERISEETEILAKIRRGETRRSF
jgi:PAS domain-containing protein